MVKIRLARIGRTSLPTYRIVVSDSRRTPSSECLADLGHFDPNSEKLVVNEEEALKWLGYGAVPSDSVKTLLKRAGVYEKFLASKTKKTGAK